MYRLPPITLHSINDFDHSESIFKTFKKGVLFVTYSSLVAKSYINGKTRLDQIVKWCGGKQFEGCLLFDEAHKAKSCPIRYYSLENKALKSVDKGGSKTGKAVIAIQDRLRNARVVYCSATGISEPSNMVHFYILYLSRLPLIFSLDHKTTV